VACGVSKKERKLAAYVISLAYLVSAKAGVAQQHRQAACIEVMVTWRRHVRLRGAHGGRGGIIALPRWASYNRRMFFAKWRWHGCATAARISIISDIILISGKTWHGGISGTTAGDMALIMKRQARRGRRRKREAYSRGERRRRPTNGILATSAASLTAAATATRRRAAANSAGVTKRALL
jgi:hypothetical protein